MTAPRTLLRLAAVQSLAAAAALNPPDPDFAPLIGAQLLAGQAWPVQSPPPGAGPLPSQLLIYGWEENSDTLSGDTTAPQFRSSMTLVVDCRVETDVKPVGAALPAAPTKAQLAAAIEGAVDALAFAVKKAICQYLRAYAVDDATGIAFLEQIAKVASANKYDDDGQRVLGQGVVSFDLVFTETFEPPIAAALDQMNVLIDATAGAVANAGNVGNGTIANVTVGLGAIAGAYAIGFGSATAFAVTDPNGMAIGTGAVGAAFSGGGIGFVISAGSQPWAANDGFLLTVRAEGSYRLNLPN